MTAMLLEYQQKREDVERKALETEAALVLERKISSVSIVTGHLKQKSHQTGCGRVNISGSAGRR